MAWKHAATGAKTALKIASISAACVVAIPFTLAGLMADVLGTRVPRAAVIDVVAVLSAAVAVAVNWSIWQWM